MANITVTPQGNIYLCKTKLENDYKNQLTFTNATAQSTYFSGTVQKTYSNYTYVKKDNYIQVRDNIDAIIVIIVFTVLFSITIFPPLKNCKKYIYMFCIYLSNCYMQLLPLACF